MTETTVDATNPCYIATLADDLQRHVMVFLEGADCCRAGGAIARWRTLRTRWWHLAADFCVNRGIQASRAGAPPTRVAGRSSAARAAGPTRAHGLAIAWLRGKCPRRTAGDSTTTAAGRRAAPRRLRVRARTLRSLRAR